MSENTQKDMKRRAPKTAWKKGQSGNPGGRPRIVAEVREYAQQRSKEAIDKLWDLATDVEQPGATRVSALKEILDRGLGRPVQATEISGPNGGPIETKDVNLDGLSDDELATLHKLATKAAKS